MRMQLSLRSMLLLVTIAGLLIGNVVLLAQLREARLELQRLHAEVGYLRPSESSEIAAVRVASEEPLVWRARVRVPPGTAYRLAYSALWRQATASPDWFAAQPLPEGESLVTLKVGKDARDERWKLSTVVQHQGRVGRMGTTLPEPISGVFRGSSDVVSAGVSGTTTVRPCGESLRLFDERFFSGQSLLLYGDSGPSEDLIGVFAELQPDIGPLSPLGSDDDR